MKKILIAFALLSFGLFPSTAIACDICAVYNAIESLQGQAGAFSAGVSHRFTHYESNIKPKGRDDLPGQHVESNIMQFYGNYNVTDEFALQLNVPVIHRDYRRVENGIEDEDSVSGVGDIVFLSEYDAYRYQREDRTLLIEVHGGIKLPTGNSHRLREEKNQPNERLFTRHGDSRTGSLIGGDDLAIGSGSYDFLFGAELLYQQTRFFISGAGQYIFRQEGDYDYEYGNEVHWNMGPGYFLALDDCYSTALRLKFSGEHKESDSVDGASLENSDDSRVFVGPEIIQSFGDNWFFTVGTDLTLHSESSSEGVTPRYRISAALAKNFTP